MPCTSRLQWQSKLLGLCQKLHAFDLRRRARTFRNDLRRDHYEAYVCEVWIWVPETSLSTELPQMDNQHWSAEHTARNQEHRDRTIAERWGVRTPYVLFSRHYYLPGLPLRPGQRWSEMVVYTQICRALIELRQLPDATVDQMPTYNPIPFHSQFKAWSIYAPEETRQEFQSKQEYALFNLSGPR
ncbi:hypothetical protein BC826DRAFT_1084804, partial [Russula brevipes]